MPHLQGPCSQNQRRQDLSHLTFLMVILERAAQQLTQHQPLLPCRQETSQSLRTPVQEALKRAEVAYREAQTELSEVERLPSAELPRQVHTGLTVCDR